MMIEDFIAARIYEDEQLALEMPQPHRWAFEPSRGDGGAFIIDADGDTISELGELRELEHGMFVAQWDPARVLLECKAKRGILLEWMGQRRRSEVDRTIPYPSPRVLQYLALSWSHHPEYRSPSWSPPEPGTVETWGRR